MVLRILLYFWRVLPLPERLRWFLMWHGNTHFVAGVSALVLNDDGHMLLFKHTYRRRHPWSLPGGWMASGELPEQAVRRELREESGFDIAVERLALVELDVTRHHFDFFYACRLMGGSFRPSAEVCDYGFFDPHDLPDVSLAQRAKIRRALHAITTR